jgi:hypothetical protein
VTTATGYAHPSYVEVFQDFGAPKLLPASGGTILVRPIPGTGERDAMGCYPLFCCDDWRALREDIETLEGLVSLVLVADPFAPIAPDDMTRIFSHVVPFKTHFIADLKSAPEHVVSPSRLRAANKALERLDVEIVAAPMTALDDWMTLQAGLTTSRGLHGMKALDRGAIARLLQVPGIVVIRASHRGTTLGMHLEFVQGDIVYGHLAAYATTARRQGVAGALHLWELRHFRGKAAYIDWGGESGVVERRLGSLANFKRGFSNMERTCFLCGTILDRTAYERLAHATGPTTYFPAYRHGEFA